MTKLSKAFRQLCGVCLHPDVKRQAVLLAERSGRSFSNLVETLLRNEIARQSVKATALELELA
jgi:hypothetical protein